MTDDGYMAFTAEGCPRGVSPRDLDAFEVPAQMATGPDAACRQMRGGGGVRGMHGEVGLARPRGRNPAYTGPVSVRKGVLWLQQ